MSWTSDKGANLLSRHGWQALKMSKVILAGARLLDPGSNLDEIGDILIDKGKILEIGKIDASAHEDAKVLNLEGKIITPGLFDMHVHLREPGEENKETILTGTAAAAAGGFTGVCCMPNTNPPLDNVGVIRWVYDLAAGGPVDVHPVASVTRNREGKELTDISDLYDAGVRALSDDGSPVESAEVMRRAMEYSSMHDMVISTHSEEKSLADGGQMREGEASTRFGLPPWPSVAESVMVARDILIAGHTGGRLHIGHISSKESIALVRWAKEMGYNVTCEASPHHMSLTDEACETYESKYKMNPPLGSEDDRKAVVEGLADGTIDSIATDHAPHTIEDKFVEFSRAPNGVVGLETALGVVAKTLVKTGILDWPAIVEKMAIAPRKILRLPDASIKTGAVANLTMIDPENAWTVDPDDFLSMGRNTPYDGWDLPAKSLGVINRGWILVAPDAQGFWKE